MSKKLTRALACLLALCMLWIAGCSSAPAQQTTPPANDQNATESGNEAETQPEQEQPVAPETQEETGYTPDFSEKLSISSNVQNAEAVPGTALWDYFQQKFNVEIELIPLTFNERHEKARLWVSSGDMPDLMWMDLDESMFAEYANWVNQGMFQAYPSMDELEAKWPNLAAYYQLENNVGDELMTIDGKWYAHTMLRDNPEYNFMSGMSWMYRRDWAKKLNLYQEDDIYTWDEWVELNKAFIEQDPGENGAGKTIGMGTELFYFPNAFGVYQTSNQYGYGAFSPKDGKYEWTAARPETLEGLLVAKDLYDQGIIWPDNPLGQTPDESYKAGLMGSDFNNFTVDRVYSVRKALKENFPDIDENEAGALAKVIGPDGTLWCKQSQCYWGAVIMSANIGEAKMTRWMDMLDWMLSKEGIYFRAYGIEGTDWELAEDGTVKCLWPESTVLPGTQADPYPDNSRSWFNWYGGAAISAEDAPKVNYPQNYIDDTNEKFAFLRDNGFMRSFDYESSYLSAENKNKSGNFTTEVSDKMIELITTASKEELPQLWNDWIASMQDKVQPVLDELNSMIEDVPVESEPRVYNK